MEKNAPEKSSSFARKDDDDEEPGSESKADKPKSEDDDVHIQSKIEEEHTEEKEDDDNIEETLPSPPPPPEIHHTLRSVSEDIDQFLSTLSTSKDHDSASPDIPEFLDKFLTLFEEKIAKHDSGDQGKSKWCQSPEDDSLFLESVDRLSKLAVKLGQLKSESGHGSLINRISGIQQRAMSYLEDEFRLLLEDSKPTDSDSSGDAKSKQEPERCSLSESESAEDACNLSGYSLETLSNLKRIAKEMISGGYESECCQVYMISRRNAFEESLIKLGFEKVSIDDVQKMQWEALEREIATWIKTFKQCAAVYFSGELRIAEAVFADYPPLCRGLFSNLTRGVVIQLLNFAEAVTLTKRSAEKVFKFLDMYETLRDNLPAMDSLFSGECANELKTETQSARCRLGETAICLFCDLENSIKSDTGKTTVPGGAVHPLTRYTMNYLKYACEYKDTLEQVFKEHSKIERADSTSRPRYEGESSQNYNDNNEAENQSSPFTTQLNRVMDLLDGNLEAKSKQYRDIALSSIFMMNNGRYILQKIKGSAEIYHLMGDTWCRKRSSDLRNYHKNYQRETWNKLLGCLSHEGLNVNGKVVKPVLKERFKSFNAMFDEIHKTQSSWVVSDEQLQSELRVSISSVVIPAYRSFLGRFSQYLDPGRQTEKYIKYQADDIETYIDELFDGKNPTTLARKRP